MEISSRFVRISFIKANFDKKRLEIVNATIIDHDAEVGGFDVEAVRRALRRFGKLSRYKIILSLDPVFSTTVHAAVVLMRDNGKEPVDDADLDNRIAQGIWKLYDRERAGAASKMKVSDLDVLLADVKVKCIKLDGHRVVNPIGFKAKAIEIQFTQTFHSRPFADVAQELLPNNQPVLIGEGGVLESDIIARADAPDSFLFLNLMPGKSSVFFSNGTDIAHIDSFRWTKEDVIQALAEFFAVDRETAEKMFGIYLIRQASPAVIKKIESLVYEEFKKLAKHISSAASRLNPEVIYVRSFFDLPEFIFGNKFRSEISGRAKILPVSWLALSEKLGFIIKSKRGLDQESFFSPLAAILSFYFLPQDDKINKIAKRHARWLIS